MFKYIERGGWDPLINDFHCILAIRMMNNEIYVFNPSVRRNMNNILNVRGKIYMLSSNFFTLLLFSSTKLIIFLVWEWFCHELTTHWPSFNFWAMLIYSQNWTIFNTCRHVFRYKQAKVMISSTKYQVQSKLHPLIIN